jgi:endonuclease/exonuclease/phosphatase family metal-dependent hydrolase
MWFRGRLRPYLVRDEPRVALVSSVEAPDGVVTFVTTHLSFLPWWNGRQLRHVMRSVVGREGPGVVMGDLNMPPARAGRLTGLRPAATAPTFPADDPSEQLDHILLSGGLRAESSEALRLPVSDHRALVAELHPY